MRAHGEIHYRLMDVNVSVAGDIRGEVVMGFSAVDDGASEVGCEPYICCVVL